MKKKKMVKKTKIVAEPFQLNGCSQNDYKMKNEQQVKNVQTTNYKRGVALKAVIATCWWAPPCSF